MTDTVPPDQRIDRPALERIIRRAAELQAAEQDIGSGLSETDLMRLGSEVGIPTPYLQQALLEERTQAFVGADGGFRHWLAGPQYVVATRTIAMPAPEVERALHHWMTTDELLVVKRPLTQQALDGRVKHIPVVLRHLSGGAGFVPQAHQAHVTIYRAYTGVSVTFQVQPVAKAHRAVQAGPRYRVGILKVGPAQAQRYHLTV